MEAQSLELVGRVEAVLVGSFGSRITAKTSKIQVIRGFGIKGDQHAGTRLADSRERWLLTYGIPKGTEIANFREFSAVSSEELAVIAEAMQLAEGIAPGLLSENLVVSGIPNFTSLPSGTFLFFRKNPEVRRTAVLVAWGENEPCKQPGQEIAAHAVAGRHLGAQFPSAANGRRGIVGCVYASGFIHEGDTVIARVPPQKIYSMT